MKTRIRISQEELFFAIVQSMIGVGVLALPYHAAQTAGSDGWITVLLFGMSLQLFVLLFWLLHRQFPNQTLFDFSTLVLGKPLGKLLHIAYILYFLIIVSYIFNIMNDILIRWILPETPQWIMLLMAVTLLIYGCVGTIKNIIAVYSFVFLFILSLCVISLMTFLDPIIDIRYLFPIASAGWRDILFGTGHILTAYIGFETLLIYLAFIKKPESLSSIKGASIAVLFVTLFYTVIVLISMMIFSPTEIQIIPEPVLYMLRTISVTVIQRWDLIFLTIWTTVVATTALSYGFLGSMGIGKLFQMKHRKAVVIAGMLVFLFSFLMHKYIDMEGLKLVIRGLHIAFGMTFPILLLIITVIFKRGVASIEKEN